MPPDTLLRNPPLSIGPSSAHDHKGSYESLNVCNCMYVCAVRHASADLVTISIHTMCPYNLCSTSNLNSPRLDQGSALSDGLT